MGQLDGRVAMVTGGGEGIGRGITTAYLNAGAKVVIAEFNEALGKKTAADLSAETGGDCRFVLCDVARQGTGRGGGAVHRRHASAPSTSSSTTPGAAGRSPGSRTSPTSSCSTAFEIGYCGPLVGDARRPSR